MLYYTYSERFKLLGPAKTAKTLYNFSMQKLDNYQNSVKLKYRPIVIQLEPTTKCNLKCSFCESPHWDRKGNDMSLSDFKIIIDQFPYLIQVLLQGIGEPLMCKDIFNMIEYCESKKIMTGITTNGTLLDNTMAEKLIDSGLSWLIVSIDGANKETFEKIRVGAKFDKVIENVRNFAELRKKTGKPKIIVHFTGSNINIKELPEVVKLSKEIGADFVETQDVHFWGNASNKQNIIDDILYSDKEKFEECKRYINDSMVEAKKAGIQFEVLGNSARRTLLTEEDIQIHADQRLCRKMWRSCFITYDGYITTCACAPNPNILNFGNILKQDFDSIWNSSEYIKYRKLRLEGEMPLFCNTCTVPHL